MDIYAFTAVACPAVYVPRAKLTILRKLLARERDADDRGATGRKVAVNSAQ